MTRRKRKPTPSSADADAGPPLVISPHMVFTTGQLSRALGLSRSTLALEVRSGRLRHAKRSKRHYFLGGWVLAWLVAGERETTPTPEGD